MHTELTAHGPLGNRNLRRQFGAGANLGPASPRGLSARLIDASSEGLDDALAQCVTITCGQTDVSDPAQAIATRMYRLEGVLRWGAQGVQQTARFDWTNGTTIRPVNGGAVVDCEMLPAFGQASIGANARAEVSAHAGYLATGTECTALLTRYGFYTGAGALVFPIPPFATRMSWYPTSLLPGVQMLWFDQAGNAIAGSTGSFRQGYGEGLVPNAYAAHVVPDAGINTGVFVVWQLAI